MRVFNCFYKQSAYVRIMCSITYTNNKQTYKSYVFVWFVEIQKNSSCYLFGLLTPDDFISGKQNYYILFTQKTHLIRKLYVIIIVQMFIFLLKKTYIPRK